MTYSSKKEIRGLLVSDAVARLLVEARTRQRRRTHGRPQKTGKGSSAALTADQQKKVRKLLRSKNGGDVKLAISLLESTEATTDDWNDVFRTTVLSQLVNTWDVDVWNAAAAGFQNRDSLFTEFRDLAARRSFKLSWEKQTAFIEALLPRCETYLFPVIGKCLTQFKGRSEDESASDGSNARRKAAQERAARERLERVGAALENLAELQEQKEKRKKGSGQKARSSMTDPEARNMKMANGGFRPAYNLQFATDGDARVIVSVDVTNNGSDGGQMAPLHQDVCDRYDKVPATYIVDGGFSANDDITTVEQSGSQVVAPMTHEDRILKQGGDPHERRPRDSDEMAAFRERMKSPEYKSLLKERPSIAEFPNAECRNRGLHQFRVRGLQKVRTSSLWYAITFNFMRMLNLGAIPS